MKCDCCPRIVLKESGKSVPCTACGHGTLHEMKPKASCVICGAPQYDNLDPTRMRICDKCTMGKVDRILAAEKKLKTDFANTADYYEKINGFYLQGNKGVKNALRHFRKIKGWSQAALGTHLGVSQQAIQKMESGKLPYGEKAKGWIKEMEKKNNQPVPNYGKADFSCETGVDSKQDTGVKNEVTDLEKDGGDHD
jgi:ribosome-binding protein aMBF1 (putative translation factor)